MGALKPKIADVVLSYFWNLIKIGYVSKVLLCQKARDDLMVNHITCVKLHNQWSNFGIVLRRVETKAFEKNGLLTFIFREPGKDLDTYAAPFQTVKCLAAFFPQWVACPYIYQHPRLW